jgi:hypothetical protein
MFSLEGEHGYASVAIAPKYGLVLINSFVCHNPLARLCYGSRRIEQKP